MFRTFLSIIPLLPVYPGAPISQRRSSTKQQNGICNNCTVKEIQNALCHLILKLSRVVQISRFSWATFWVFYTCFKITWYRFLSVVLSANYMAIITLAPRTRALHEWQVFEINSITGLVGNHYPCTYTVLRGHLKGINTSHYPCYPPIPVDRGPWMQMTGACIVFTECVKRSMTQSRMCCSTV